MNTLFGKPKMNHLQESGTSSQDASNFYSSLGVAIFPFEYRALKTALVEPVITPRFVPSCTPELLKGLGKVAREHSVAIQSHISESLDEVAFCKALHPEVHQPCIISNHSLEELHPRQIRIATAVSCS